MSSSANVKPSPAVVQRQIVLPLSKAVEIAYKSIRQRLSRSLLVTSGIILALAFLMAIQSGELIIEGMRDWMAAASGKGAPDSAVARHFATLRADGRKLEAEVAGTAQRLNAAAARAPEVPKGATKFDPKAAFGGDWKELDKTVGKLPADADRLTRAMTADPALAEVMRQWIGQTSRLKAVKAEIKSPEDLSAEMTMKGVPTTPDEIASSKTQTRWLLGLALLVAFVGILNAMLMSVTERFREIGTMKCLGALDSFIIKLFLIESLFQGIVGTVLGVTIGMLLTMADAASKYGGYAFKMLPWGDILLTAGFCFLVGVILTVAGAVYPAWQAARMQPIEAMRVET